MYRFFVVAFFILVTISHVSFLLVAKSRQRKPEIYRKRLWQMHFTLNSFLWTILSVLLINLQFTIPHILFPFWLKLLGVTILLIGLLFVKASFVILGLRQAMGYRFFFPDRVRRTQKGVYQHLKNPTYDGFILIFIGLGLTLGLVWDFYLALLSFILLNVLLATLENYERPRNFGDFF